MHSKKQCRLTIGKHGLIWNKQECRHSAGICFKNVFDLFHGTVFFSILPETEQKTRGFLSKLELSGYICKKPVELNGLTVPAL